MRRNATALVAKGARGKHDSDDCDGVVVLQRWRCDGGGVDNASKKIVVNFSFRNVNCCLLWYQIDVE